MKKIRQIFLDFPHVSEIKIIDSGETIKCKTNNGGIYLCTTFKELKRELKKDY